MLPLRKRKTEAPPPTTLPAWHPDFRNVEQLPDTKVVRTAFFVNGIAVLAALVMLLWFGYGEYQLRSLNRQLATMQREIDRDRPASNKAIALYKKFQAAESRVNEVDAFIRSRPRISELLLHFAETLPAFVALDRFDVRGSVVTIRGSVRGAPELASGNASVYVDQMKKDPVLTAQFERITLKGLTRNQQTGQLSVEVSLVLRNTPVEGKKP